MGGARQEASKGVLDSLADYLARRASGLSDRTLDEEVFGGMSEAIL